MSKTIILHIPHSSSDFSFAGSDISIQMGDEWLKLATPLIDWYTDELFTPEVSESRLIPIVFDTCRTLVDVERMCNDPLEYKGLGITAYTLLPATKYGDTIRQNRDEDIRYMKKYLEHQHELANLLVENQGSLLIDCHSFSSRPTVLQPDASKTQDIDICIGFNEDETRPNNEVLDLIYTHFLERGYKVAFNTPFSNSKTVETPARYTSLMIEINKGIYMDEDTLEKSETFEKIRKDICSLYEKLS
jgi:N-formylglutamate amidohydrolase